MDYKELIKELLEGITEEKQLEFIYHLIIGFLD